MKNKFLLLLLLLLIPVISKAEVKITNVELVDKTEELEAEEHPKFEGLTIDLDIYFEQLEQYAKYAVTINNDTDKTYEVDQDKIFDEREYIRYDYEYPGNLKEIKPGEEKEILVTITYIKEIPDNKFDKGIYTEGNDMSISLITKVESPNTKSGYYIFGIMILMLISLIILLSLYKNRKIMITSLIITLLLPLTIHALNKITITINTTITVETMHKEAKTTINFCGKKAYEFTFSYEKGMTWDDVLTEEYLEPYFEKYNIPADLIPQAIQNASEYTNLFYYQIPYEYLAYRPYYDTYNGVDLKIEEKYPNYHEEYSKFWEIHEGEEEVRPPTTKEIHPSYEGYYEISCTC